MLQNGNQRFGAVQSFEYDVLLSIADFYIHLYRSFEDPILLHLAFSCIDFARDLGSSALLPDIYNKVDMNCFILILEDRSHLRSIRER